LFLDKGHKNPIKRSMARNHTAGETKRKGPKKGQKMHSLLARNKKKKRQLVPLVVVGSYVTHGPSNVACMCDWGDLIVMGEVESEEEAALNPSYLIMSSALMLSIPNF
jgi:co-chaperonin GroES (HSP10)